MSLMYPNVVFVRCVWITLFVLVLVWIEEYMGGFDSSPEDTGPDRNDTSRLFNWHPFLMILAFPVFMTEAIFTYTALPGVLLRRQAHPPMLDDSCFTLTVCSRRDLRKIVHAVLQTLVLLAMLFGLIAVFRSHTEKKPKAMDDLYSPHSYMGICTMAFFVLQYLCGIFSFVLPILTPSQRAFYARYHHFFGTAAYLIGMATIMAGLQEKSTFNRKGGRHINFKGSYEPLSVIPAVMTPLIILLATAVTFQSAFLKEPPVVEEPVPEEGPSMEAQQPLVKSEREAAT